MKVTAFEFRDTAPSGFTLDPIQLHKGMNLFVGASGAGKTRFLNILFNIGLFVASDSRFCNGTWKLNFEHKGKKFEWQYKGIITEDRQGKVLGEDLWIVGPGGDRVLLVSRTEGKMTFQGVPVPRLASNSTALFLLREEPEMTLAHEAFTHIMRRNFSGEALGEAGSLQSVPRALVAKLEKNKDIAFLRSEALSLHALFYLLHRFFPNVFQEIIANFKLVFPSVEGLEVRMRDASITIAPLNFPVSGEVPVALVRERNVENPVVLSEMSSGMLKVLLIISDIVLASPELLYMIDEYENSLGINAIDFLPGFLNEHGGERQFLVTSHHPSLINSIPVSAWFVVSRKGTHIRIKHGRELEQRYGTSKQQKFTQLINDPFFAASEE